MIKNSYARVVIQKDSMDLSFSLKPHFKMNCNDAVITDVTRKESNTPHDPNGTEYDVIIVGAGVAGCSAAYHLLTQQRKDATTTLKILVVDAGSAPGEGLPPDIRSGTATMEVASCIKMMIQLFAGSCDDFVRHHGHEGARKYLDATREGLAIQKEIAGRIWSSKEEYRKHLKELGSYYVGSTEQDEIEMKREFEILSSLMQSDDGIEWCDAARLSSVEGISLDFRFGIYFPKDAIIDSSFYAKMLMKYVLKTSGGNIEFWPNTVVQSIDSYCDSKRVSVKIDDKELRNITTNHVVLATGAIRLLQSQHEFLNGLMKPCYSYLVHIPTTNTCFVDSKKDNYCSPNFFTWGYTHDWCYTNGKIRVSGEDHFSAYKSPRVEERCNRLSQWTLERYHCLNSYTEEKISSFPRQYGLYSETIDMVPIVGTSLSEQNICWLLGCNAWGQTILSCCASLVPGLLGYQEFTVAQRDILKLVSMRRFSRVPPN